MVLALVAGLHGFLQKEILRLLINGRNEFPLVASCWNQFGSFQLRSRRRLGQHGQNSNPASIWRGVGLEAPWAWKVGLRSKINQGRFVGNSLSQADISAAIYWQFAVEKRPNFCHRMNCTKMQSLSDELSQTWEFLATPFEGPLPGGLALGLG